MNAETRASFLAAAAAAYPELCPPTAGELIETLRLELGDPRVLEEFCPYAGGLTRALAPGTILHIVSGNTPHAALQSMLRGLLLGSHNLVKFPSGGLGELENFRTRLPEELAAKLECAREIQPGWRERADAWVVFGDDATVETLRRACPAGKIFDAHGHRVSYAVIFDDPTLESSADVAWDVSAFDQRGCLSPHVIYVANQAREYAARLAVEMARFAASHPPGALLIEERADLLQRRESLEFEARSNPDLQIWKSERVPGWTVVFEADPTFRLSPLSRFVYVKPLPVDLAASVSPIRHVTGGIGIFPPEFARARALAEVGASRICPVGKMQATPFSWHSESRRNLGDLVQWVDWHGPVC